MRVVEISGFGGTDTLTPTDRAVPEPGPGEIRIAVEAAGINFADIMQRQGLYPDVSTPPFVPGLEVAGEVDAVGPGVDLAPGDPVAAMLDGGGYAEYAIADADMVLPVPAGISTAAAAALPVQFVTAHCCLFEWGGLEAGERVLIQAAAGGVGTAAVQLAADAGAEVFGTASTAEKLEYAADLGCDHPINYTETDFVAAVEEATDGEGVDLVLESVGGDVFEDSIDALAHFGRLVTIGASSRQIGTVQHHELLAENKSVHGFHLGFAAATDRDRVAPAIEPLVAALESGDLEIVVDETFSLEEAARAHDYVEGRESMGKVLLAP